MTIEASAVRFPRTADLCLLKIHFVVGGVMGKIAILSAGNTGIAAALHVSSLGYNPMVYTRNAAKLAALQGSAISSTGVIDGLWKIHVSDNLAEVLDGADFIIICTWANNHNDVFKNVRDWAKNKALLDQG